MSFHFVTVIRYTEISDISIKICVKYAFETRQDFKGFFFWGTTTDSHWGGHSPFPGTISLAAYNIPQAYISGSFPVVTKHCIRKSHSLGDALKP